MEVSDHCSGAFFSSSSTKSLSTAYVAPTIKRSGAPNCSIAFSMVWIDNGPRASRLKIKRSMSFVANKACAVAYSDPDRSSTHTIFLLDIGPPTDYESLIHARTLPFSEAGKNRAKHPSHSGEVETVTSRSRRSRRR